jgi:ribosome-binding ATPase
MKIGIIGLQNSGKTTIFNALTKGDAEVTAYASSKVEPNLAVVDVKDPRITKLSEMYNPKKTVYATVEFIDFVGLSSGSAREGVFSGEAMGLMKTVDALCVVVRNFHDETIDAVEGEPKPVSDMAALDEELVFSDLVIIEKRLERIDTDIARGRKTPELLAEQKLLNRIKEHLDDLKPLRAMDFSGEELKMIGGFQFLSLKPVLVILNSGEDNYGQNDDTIAELSKQYNTIEFAGKFEMDLSGLDDEEARAFMEDFGINESARDRLIAFAYNMLGYISFFTVGEDEVRAWTIRKGLPAVEAAGAIHSDLQRGFIRAECFTYDDLAAAGSEKGVKENGKLRLEGKTYTVRDGDILNIRFSV